MAGLALKLAPNERVLINGVVVENGPRRTKLLIRTDDAAVLRLRDALHPDDVIGPLSGAYYCAQLCVAGEAEAEEAARELNRRIGDLRTVFASGEERDAVEEAASYLRARDFYRVMRALKDLLPLERRLLDPMQAPQEEKIAS